jgi:DNA-binding transcriptional regulator YiaG
MKQSEREAILANQTRHEPDMSRYKDEAPMSSAEFKCLREYMGFSTKWLSLKWGVSEFSIQRWERNRQPPPDMAHWMRGMLEQFGQRVDDAVHAGETTLLVPRTDDDSPNVMPAAVYRRIAMIAALRMEAGIEYLP